jgi:hypothetical protein
VGTVNEIISYSRSFMKSRVILTSAELDLFTELDGTTLSAKEIADRLELNERALTRLLDCLITFELLEKRDGRYSITESGAYLSSQNPDTMLPIVKHMNEIWDNWSFLTASVKKGDNPHLKSVVDAQPEEERESFICAMHVAAKGISKEIAGAYDLSPFNKLLDIGGGSGAYTKAFLKKNPELNAILFDLKDVIPIAEKHIGKEKLQDRVDFIAGNFYTDKLPGGCDLALLSAIIHQNSPEQNLELYKKVYLALDPGGVLLIRDHIMDSSRTNPPAGALFALNMLVNTPAGDTYTFEEVKTSLETTGFQNVKLILSGKKMNCLVEASKP